MRDHGTQKSSRKKHTEKRPGELSKNIKKRVPSANPTQSDVAGVPRSVVSSDTAETSTMTRCRKHRASRSSALRLRVRSSVGAAVGIVEDGARHPLAREGPKIAQAFLMPAAWVASIPHQNARPPAAMRRTARPPHAIARRRASRGKRTVWSSSVSHSMRSR